MSQHLATAGLSNCDDALMVQITAESTENVNVEKKKTTHSGCCPSSFFSMPRAARVAWKMSSPKDLSLPLSEALHLVSLE